MHRANAPAFGTPAIQVAALGAQHRVEYIRIQRPRRHLELIRVQIDLVPQVARVNQCQNVPLVQPLADLVVVQTAISHKSLAPAAQARIQKTLQQRFTVRVFVIARRHQIEVNRQLTVDIAQDIERISKPGFLGNLLLAVGIGAVLLVTAPGGVRVRSLAFATAGLRRELAPGRMRLDGLPVLCGALNYVAQLHGSQNICLKGQGKLSAGHELRHIVMRTLYRVPRNASKLSSASNRSGFP